ncbi:hypothetical protein BJX68DRAFT_241969 [Aspergillus pseudodeflectus]|uniref:F-box domain-containing protein n=1 Tax=Aspergillus pseudodeflectus TaxID=176178 RepID=A0ABR4JZT6_9EURO
MNDVRLICENNEATSINKVFITGPARYDDSGFFDVEPSDHPNFPTGNQMGLDNHHDGQLSLRGYDWGNEHPYAIPFHTKCYRILEACLSPHNQIPPNAREDSIDEEALYLTWMTFANQSSFQCLASRDVLPYGVDTDEQYWAAKRGEEAFVMDPLEIPLLQEYYEHLPLLRDADTVKKGKSRGASNKTQQDPFARLPVELLLTIVGQLPLASMKCLQVASSAVARLELSTGFWKRKIRRDMPWLFDLPDPVPAHCDENQEEEPDWAKCYADLLERSDPSSPLQIRGLVNRRRIWGVCEEFVQPYATRKATINADRARSKGSLLANAASTPMRQLTSMQAGSESSVLPLLKNLSDIKRASALLVYWSNEGALSGFGFRFINNPEKDGEIEAEETIGSRKHFAKRDEVKILSNGWIRGFVVTSRSDPTSPDSERKVVGLQVLSMQGKPVQLGQSPGDGDLRLIHVEGNHLLAGLLAHWLPEAGVISGLSLLQVSPFVPESPPLAMELAQNQGYTQEADTEITSRLWKGITLPPPWLSLSPEKFGYWTSDLKLDLAPMEPLLFGWDDAELSEITEFAGDVHFGAFEIRYSNKPPKSIGPRPLTMKSLSIDGAGGERIVAVAVVVSHITVGVRVITSYNRQLVLGSCRPDESGETVYASTGEKTLSGIYCHWTDRGSPKARLECLAGMFSTPLEANITPPELPPPTGPQDTNATNPSHTHWWEPSPPPGTWAAAGPIHGSFEPPSHPLCQSTAYPSRNACTAWLDCTMLPVHKVRLNYAHPSQHFPFSVTSLVFEYMDGSIGSVGPTRLSAPTDSEGDKGGPWCWCHLDGGCSEYKAERGKTTHYHSGEEWVLEGGAMLEACRIWVDGSADGGSGCGPLRGLQFVSVTGEESPRWGTCDGSATAVIRFDSGEVNHDHDGDGDGNDQKAVGLKIFLDSNGREVTYPDTIIVGIQALVEG